MKVDKITMLITDFENIDTEKLLDDVDKLVFSGEITHFLRGVFEVWRNQCDLDDRQGLLVISTVFPLRIYMSIAKLQ